MQIHDNNEIVIAYGGWKLSAHEQHYSATEREALAVVAGIFSLTCMVELLKAIRFLNMMTTPPTGSWTI